METLDSSDVPALRPVVIRRMRGSDIEQVARIERLSCAIPWSAQAYVTEITNPAASYFVATDGMGDERGIEKVLGYGGLWTVMDESHLTTLAVHPDLRGQKIGERILVALLDAAQSTGAKRATLEVRINNDPARYLYEKYGFIWVAIRPKYYINNKEDAIVMWINDFARAEWQALFEKNRAAFGNGDK